MRTITLAVIASLSTAAHLGDEDAPTAAQLWDAYNTGTDTLSMDDFEIMYNETVAEDLVGDETMSALNLWNTAEHGLSFGEWEQVYWMVADWYSYTQSEPSSPDDIYYNAPTACSNMAAPGDTWDDGCNEYLTQSEWCGQYDSDTFNSWDCCACQGNFAGEFCSDADWPQDSALDGCDQYALYPSWCGSGTWDDEDFASSNCCACQATDPDFIDSTPDDDGDYFGDYSWEEPACDPYGDSAGDGCDWYLNGSCDGTWDTECFFAANCEGCWYY